MLVKSVKFNLYTTNLKEGFGCMTKPNVHLKRTKCAFRVKSGKLLAFIVSDRGIEVNPNKFKVIGTS